MFNNWFYSLAILALLFIGLTTVKEVEADSRATNISCSQVSPGRYQVLGTVVDSTGRPACGLALASGRCVFSCGPGSLRCEGGTDSLSIGQFDLTNLPTEPNGTIVLQTFVAGNLPGQQVIDPSNGCNMPNYNLTGRWEGTIRSSVYSDTFSFTTNLIQEGSTLRGSVTVPKEPRLTNANLTGNISGNSITCQVAGAADYVVQMTGTVSADGNTLSGSFVSPNDYGTWQAIRTQ